MQYGVTIWAVLGLAGSSVATTMWAQAPPRQPLHLVGRVIDERRSPVDGVRQITVAPSPDRGPRTFTVEDEPEIAILSRINPSDVEMIEVCSGASEIPGVFNWNGCAVVAIWSRWNT